MRIPLRVLSLLLLAPLAMACTGGNSSTPVVPTPPPNPNPNPNPQPIPVPSPPVTFVGAGDIADCSAGDRRRKRRGDREADRHGSPTASSSRRATTPISTARRRNSRTATDRAGDGSGPDLPEPGNHEYQIAVAALLRLFRRARRPARRRLLQLHLGNWHIIALNSDFARRQGSDSCCG